MKIFHSKQKEIFIVKDVEELNPNSFPRKDYKTKVDEIVDNMFIKYPKNFTFSNDVNMNTTLSKIKNDDNMMKMSIGKEQGKLTIFIRAVNNQMQDEENRVINKPKIEAKLLFPKFFEFFDANELFRLRIICKSWKYFITQSWHGVFSKEMHKHLVVNECKKEIEKSFKLMAVRQPVAQKFGIFATAISELIEWDAIKNLTIETGPMRRHIRLLMTALVKLLDFDNIVISKLDEFSDIIFEQSILPYYEVEGGFREFIQSKIKDPSLLPHLPKIIQYEEDFMNYSEIWMSSLRMHVTREPVLLRLMIRHIIQYATIRNSMMISKRFLSSIKNFVNQESYSNGVSKMFLEGAYKIMIFSSSAIIDGDEIILDGRRMETNILEGMRESIEITNLIQKLFTCDEVLLSFITENQVLVNQYFEQEKQKGKPLEAEEIMRKIENEAKDIKRITIEKLREANAGLVNTEEQPMKNHVNDQGIDECETSKNDCDPHIKANSQGSEDRGEDDEGSEMEIPEYSVQTYIEELLEKSIPSNKDRIIDMGAGSGHVVILQTPNHPESNELIPTFFYTKEESSVSIYLDGNAKRQFLLDALRYLECMIQVKRLNNCLKMQFLSVQNKLRQVEELCEKEMANKSANYHSQTERQTNEISCQTEPFEIEELPEEYQW